MPEGSRTPAGQAAWGGIILSLLTIRWEDILQTAVLAAIGTIVSFCMSALLKKMYKRFKKS